MSRPLPVKPYHQVYTRAFEDNFASPILVTVGWSVAEGPAIHLTVSSKEHHHLVLSSIIAKFEPSRDGWGQAIRAHEALSKEDVLDHLYKTKVWTRLAPKSISVVECNYSFDPEGETANETED